MDIIPTSSKNPGIEFGRLLTLSLLIILILVYPQVDSILPRQGTNAGTRGDLVLNLDDEVKEKKQ